MGLTTTLSVTRATVDLLLSGLKLKLDGHLNSSEAHGLGDVRTRLTSVEGQSGLGLYDFSTLLLADTFDRADGALGSAPTGTKAGAYLAYPGALPVISGNKAISADPATPAQPYGGYRDMGTRDVMLTADIDVSGGKTGLAYLDARFAGKSISMLRRGTDNTLQLQQNGVSLLILNLTATGVERIGLLVVGALARVIVNGQVVASVAIDPSDTAGYGTASGFKVSGGCTVDNFSARAVAVY